MTTPVPENKAAAASAPAPAANPLLQNPVGIPAGPSALELMKIVQQQGEQIAQMRALLEGNMQRTEAAAEPEHLEEKTYFHQTPGSSIIVEDTGPGGEHIPRIVYFDFRGELTTADLVVRKFLDSIADRPGVPICTKSKPQVSADAQEAANQVIANASRSIDKLGAEAVVKA